MTPDEALTLILAEQQRVKPSDMIRQIKELAFCSERRALDAVWQQLNSGCLDLTSDRYLVSKWVAG